MSETVNSTALKDMKAMATTLEDLYWRFKDMEAPSDGEESEYASLFETMDGQIGSLTF